jgi:hypothetical protein
LNFPDDDSPDLTDEEIAAALPSGSAKDLAKHLNAPCVTCGATGGKSAFRNLKRGSHYYSRVTVTCPAGHQATTVFETTWYRMRRA